MDTKINAKESRNLQAEGRKAQCRNRKEWKQVEITELPEREDGLPF